MLYLLTFFASYHNLNVRLLGMGRGLGRGLGTNAHATTSGGLEFRRGPLGGGFSPGVVLRGRLSLAGLARL
ncbi:hypothetical protein Hanom_Chr14g01279101 [Helianthus anomalus]